MRKTLLFVAAAALTAASALAAEAVIVSYAEGTLNFVVKGTGTVTVTAVADYKYISETTGDEALARSESPPLKVKLTGVDAPGTIAFAPPAGTLEEVEIVLFVNGDEKARQTFYF